MGEVQPPGDHAFCLLGVPSKPVVIEYNTVRDFTKSKLAKKTYIVDPWLNTVCWASRYLEHANMRLQKWQQDCKRISWKGKDGKDPGYHPPLGDYADVFADHAPLKFIPFSGFERVSIEYCG